MKAITVQQPWATLITLGHKTIETRPFNFHYRGPLAIHSSLKLPVSWYPFRQDEFVSALAPVCSINEYEVPMIDELPRGVVLAVVTLLDVRATSTLLLDEDVPREERVFGDFSEGRYAWYLGEPAVQIHPPVPAKGNTRIWEWEPTVRIPDILERR